MVDYSGQNRDRKPIIWAVGVSRLKHVLQELAPHYAERAEIHIIDKGFDEAVEAIKHRRRTDEADALVAAGSNGAFLRRHLALPVALVTLTGFDVLKALAEARRISERIGVVTHGAVPPELAQFKAQFGLPLTLRAYHTADDARARVRELADAGTEAIIGPGLVADLAVRSGLAGIFLYSHHSVAEALDKAIEIARVGRVEVARRERLDTILKQLNEGVVAVDMDERVQSFNPALERLLSLPAEQAIGRRLSEIAPSLSLRSTLEQGRAELERIHRLGSRTLVTNRIPIREQGVQTGAVMTLQDSAAIQRVDRSLRSTDKPRQLAAKYELDQLLGSSPRCNKPSGWRRNMRPPRRPC
ncbi:PrpR N-terminal domain-containing protein [Alkalilimnicola ehrlichii]|uniref:PrpR N-terminal domain-containing protein n=1 Tax=Alkalilimnicola ehrlichii TaxID=351052 RepID=UPI001C6F48C2|nr:PrpR N-terminal domain-containing protein [Alkalilimnicola ehrlichii]